MARDEPLILTLGLDPASFARLDAARRAHFPPERNHIPAHLTLFHALPAAEEPAVVAALREATEAPAPRLRVTGLRFLGRGVAYAVESPGLATVRAGLARRLAPLLGAQDRQGWRPHVTVQNKASPEAARATFRELEAGFAPWEAAGEALLLWRYMGGPWEGAGVFPFTGQDATPAVPRRCPAVTKGAGAP